MPKSLSSHILINQALDDVFGLGDSGILDEATKKSDCRSPISRVQGLCEHLHLLKKDANFSC